MTDKRREKVAMFVLMTFFFMGYGAILYYGLNWAVGLTWGNVLMGGLYWLCFTGILGVLAWLAHTKENGDSDDGDDDNDPSASEPPPSADEIEHWVKNGADKS